MNIVEAENFQGAFLERYKDTETLCQSDRKVAAMHFGGVTVECLLKAIILDKLPPNTDRVWKNNSNSPGHTTTNPGHKLHEAVKRNPHLFQRVQQFPEVIRWINAVENPSQHFIDMRYSDKQIADTDYKSWYSDYKSLIRWLQIQATRI
ncbi:MAG: hypothetical protein ACK5QS_02620 [Pseudanabaenaceae cyanobacterium]|jgi:hypothetical protein